MKYQNMQQKRLADAKLQAEFNLAIKTSDNPHLHYSLFYKYNQGEFFLYPCTKAKY